MQRKLPGPLLGIPSAQYTPEAVSGWRPEKCGAICDFDLWLPIGDILWVLIGAQFLAGPSEGLGQGG